MLYEMKLNQVSAFQFINIVKSGQPKYIRQSLEKLSLAADYLGDDTLLNYAISKVEANKFPLAHRDMLFYRVGEFLFRNDQYKDALNSLRKVSTKSRFYPKARYMQGLIFAKVNKPTSAVKIFNRLLNSQDDEGVTNSARVSALIGKARALYQNKKWDEAIESYRKVPRDTKFWHDSLFESSWALLRTGRFRSALSNFHTIHSSYYEGVYQPESFILREIIYLYICKYTEMEKVLSLFNQIYKPVHSDIVKVLNNNRRNKQFYQQVAQVGDVASGKKSINNFIWKIPYIVARKIFFEGDFKRNYNYINKIEEEKLRLNNFSPKWRSSAIARYSKKVLANRILKAKSKASRIVFEHLLNIKSELVDLFEQQDFIEFEMLKGKKQTLKQSIAKTEKEKNTKQVNERQKRDYYVQNGYEYWPFQNEYWLDELGNYHYVGTSSCN